ncbi:MAG: 2-oxoglutarate dehydrogenase E1 component [Gammaproteobacteria bacterium]|nr:2-oxoglutarate dehydrogenase E1 component [Gammaproteobacteria bacterium]
MSDKLEQKYRSSPLYGGNASVVEGFYEQYLEDPGSVPPGWRDYFKGISNGADIAHGPIREEFLEKARHRRAAANGSSPALSGEMLDKQAAVLHLIERHRLIGHLQSDLDPLKLEVRQPLPDLQPGHYRLGDADMETSFSTGNLAGLGMATLREVLDMVRTVYCGPVGAEFMHVSDTEERRWLQTAFETAGMHARLAEDEKRNVLERLTAAEGIERYLHTKYVGQKRFSLEGGETLIPMLDDLVQKGGENGLEDMVIGMAHRGRINVLVNILGKSPERLFAEFEGDHAHHDGGSGDVKYHMGFSSDVKTPGGNVHVALAFNPSHLEIVNPVVEGSVRARQERRRDVSGSHVMPVLIHGDAAFAGQGVVMETLQMSQIRGFHTGGTVHIVINNQVGFTTSNPADMRSTHYCTDVAKMIEAPVFHVNADRPEAVILVTRLALEYRMKFGKDVVIDLVCYRRHGHNEADEPAATQPVMYKVVRKHPTTRELYAEKLAKDGVLKGDEAKSMVEAYRDGLDKGEVRAHGVLGLIGNEFTVDWSDYGAVDWSEASETGVDAKRLKDLAAGLTTIPDGFKMHARVKRIMDDRKKMATGEIPMDWGFAETLAYATLVTEGFKVRLCGQDSGRGTFFHRHAVLHGQEENQAWIPLKHLADEQRTFTVIDSFLSEEAVLGFEYGYATAAPKSLVIWEGQFGDFVNGAQVVIDQFISSGEAKWGRYCGLTMFLPHGYEGQGPEHSSARLERFLQLCAEHNMQVCVPSSPAQMFHMLRRQMLRSFRKPLVVMTPKSLLRHRESVSSLAEIESGGFRTLIDEVDKVPASKISRVVFCSGKVYYDLLTERRERELSQVAIVRIEQLYPFPIEEYAATVKRYKNASEIVWCQEEPQNQGAWYQIRHRLQEPLQNNHELIYAGRDHAASPAVGYYQVHVEQQAKLVADALGLQAQDKASKPKQAKSKSASRKKKA